MVGTRSPPLPSFRFQQKGTERTALTGTAHSNWFPYVKHHTKHTNTSLAPQGGLGRGRVRRVRAPIAGVGRAHPWRKAVVGPKSPPLPSLRFFTLRGIGAGRSLLAVAHWPCCTSSGAGLYPRVKRWGVTRWGEESFGTWGPPSARASRRRRTSLHTYVCGSPVAEEGSGSLLLCPSRPGHRRSL